MKIQGVTTYIKNTTGWRNWLYVRIDTDEGIHGIGEAMCTGPDKALDECIKYFGTWLINEDPNDTEKIRQKLIQYSRFPAGNLINSAASAIDIALWDIKGKAAGQPLYRLLGGAVRDKVWVYCHAHGKTPEEALEVTQQKAEKYGYNVVKAGVANQGNRPYAKGFREAEKTFRTLREGLGEDFEICTDIGCAYFEPSAALQAARAIAPYRPFYMEEPIRPENFDEMAILARQFREIGVPLATGEEIMQLHDWRRFLEMKCADILQPEILLVGGITGMKKLDDMAGPYFRKISMHAARGPVANAANIHAAMSMPNFMILEHEPVDIGVKADMVTDILETKDGYTMPNDKPGLGLDFNYEFFENLPNYNEWNFSKIVPGDPTSGVRDHDGGIHVK